MPKIINFKVFVFCLLISLTRLSWAESKTIVIEIPAQIVVAKQEIKLHDLGKISGENQALVQKLGEIRLGVAPSPGQMRTFTDTYLKFLLKEYLSEVWWELRMPEMVAVQTAYTCITEEELKQVICNKLPQTPSERQIWLEIANLPQKIYLAQDKCEIQVEPLSDLTKLGTVIFRVALVQRGKVSKTLNISGRLRAKGVGYQSLRFLTKGATLQESDFKKVAFELHSGQELLGALPLGYRLAKSMRAGMILSNEQIETIPLIFKNNEVKVLITEELFELKIMAIAQSDGWLNDQIKLLNPVSRRSFWAKVIAPNTVEVSLK